MLEGKHISFWLADNPKSIFPKIASNQKTDVLIVGGGLAGMILAYYLQRSKVDFILVESRQISHGVSGHSSAKITSLHGLIYAELVKRDLKTAKLYAEANQQAIDSYFKIIDELNIECDLRKMPAYTYAGTEQDSQKIKDEVEAAKKCDLPARHAKIDFLPFETFGAVKFDDQARFDPYKFLTGISKFLKANNAKIFENSPVREIEYKKNPIVAKLDEGQITSNKIVVLTNYPIIDPDLLFAKLIPRRSYVLLAKPNLDIPLGLYYSTEENFHSFRPHPYRGEEAWLFGSELHLPGRDDNTIKRYENLQSWVKENFETKKIFYRWSTHDSRSLDKIPIVGRATKKYKNVFIGTGFKGWGITNTMAAAGLLADLLQERKNQFESLYDPSRTSLLVKKEAVTFNIPTIATLIGENLMKFKGDVKSLKNGEARIIELNENKAAVYKDENGQVHALSAHCRHMGCIVHFNNAEKSWDCPCHASRYQINGEVIHSPASKPLDKIDLEK